MELFTLDRGFVKQDDIDFFEQVIWTERYYGDGDFELSVPATDDVMAKLPKGQLLMCEDSEEPMILETRDIKNGLLKTSGIALTQWLNNRTIRVFSDWTIKEWNLGAQKPGYHMCYLVEIMCVDGSPIFDGTWPIGIPVPQVATWMIPGLVIGDEDLSGVNISPAVPFGPLYDVLKELATTYEVGMKIVVDFADASDYQISFNSYSGIDRTSDQSVNPVIRFSPEMDSFTDIQDLESLADTKTDVYMFAPSAPPGIIGLPGYATSLVGAEGFDLRVLQAFADDVDTTGMTMADLTNVLNLKAANEANNRKVVQLVDGQIVETDSIKYGTNFFLGDVVEVEGNTGVLKKARITEYIRSQDKAGERAYPTLSMID